MLKCEDPGVKWTVERTDVVVEKRVARSFLGTPFATPKFSGPPQQRTRLRKGVLKEAWTIAKYSGG